MKVIGSSTILGLALAVEAMAAEGAGAAGPHVFRIQYTNSWSEVALSPKGAGRTPAGPQDLDITRVQNAIRSFEATPIAEDPLYIDMTLSLANTTPDRLALRVDVEEVRYFDDRGRRWTLKRGAAGMAEQATRILKEAAAAWRNVHPLSLETEMLEEQMAGAAVFLLAGIPFAADVGAGNGDPSLPQFSDLLREKLPGEFPAAVRGSVEWIFREAVAKIVGPPVAGAREGAELDRRGVPCRVKKVRAGKAGAMVLVEGQMHWQATGVACKEAAAIAAETGLVVELKVITVRDALRGRSHRFGTTRWEVNQVRQAGQAPSR